MNRFASITLAGLVVAAPALAAEPVLFEGSIWNNGGVALAFDSNVSPGQTRSMRLSGGQTVEMSVDAEGTSVVRLVDRSGRELHASNAPADSGPRVFMYSLCRKGAVAFTSPPDKTRSGCP